MAQCQLHASIVLDVAAVASLSGRSAWLGVIYDELIRYLMPVFPLTMFDYFLSRKEWEDLSGKLRAEFSMDSFCMKQDEEILRQAKAVFDNLVSKNEVCPSPIICDKLCVLWMCSSGQQRWQGRWKGWQRLERWYV